jgi:hypothetical protein
MKYVHLYPPPSQVVRITRAVADKAHILHTAKSTQMMFKCFCYAFAYRNYYTKHPYNFIAAFTNVKL